MSEKRERGGRRRRLYEISARGRAALDDWRREPTAASLGELREPSLLKLFFGADPVAIAEAQLPAHRAKLGEYEAIRDGMPANVPPGPRLALEAGIRNEHNMIAFWEELAQDG